jgi:hypothetical protein
MKKKKEAFFGFASHLAYALMPWKDIGHSTHEATLFFEQARVCKDIIHYFPVFAPRQTINLTFEGKNFRLEANVFSLLIEWYQFGSCHQK